MQIEEAQGSPAAVKPEPDSLKLSESPEVEPKDGDDRGIESNNELDSDDSVLSSESNPGEGQTTDPSPTTPRADESVLENVDKPFPDYEEISVQFALSKKDDLIIPYNSIKRSFSDLQSESNRHIPHLHLGADVDCTLALKWLQEFNQRTRSSISTTDLIMKACGHALALIPEMNAYVRPDRIILKRSINIGLTTTVDEGVVSPVVPDVYHKSLIKVSEVARKNLELATTTKVVLDYDTTFTLSTLEDFGIQRFQTRITPPQTAALAIGAIQKRVVPVEDFIGIRQIAELNLACDHRAIDSNTAGRFLNLIREKLENFEVGIDPVWIKGNEQLRLI